MITEIAINTYHIALIGCIFMAAIIFMFLLHNFGGVCLFVHKDKEIVNKFLEKFPLVTVDYINKSTKEQNIENNQEIHEINKKIEEQNQNIDKLVKIIGEISGNGQIH